MDHIGDTLFSNACPHCSRGELFKSFFELHDKCSNCGAVYSRDPGEWTGPTVMTYMLALSIAFVLLVLMWTTDNLWSGSEFILAGVVMAVVLPCHRASKAIWVGILYDMGRIYPDPTPELEHDKPAA